MSGTREILRRYLQNQTITEREFEAISHLIPPTSGSAGGKTTPLTTQIGGAHYKKYSIQPIEFAMANDLNYCQANAIKYICRYRDKGGLEDLKKAVHNIQILMELEYGEGSGQVHG